MDTPYARRTQARTARTPARTELLGALHEARQNVRGDGLRRVPDAQRDDLGVRVGLQEGRAAAPNLGEEVAGVVG